jgi:hypothetical protein
VAWVKRGFVSQPNLAARLVNEPEALRKWPEFLEWMYRRELAEPGLLPKQVTIEEERP